MSHHDSSAKAEDKPDKKVDFHSKIDAHRRDDGVKEIDAKMTMKSEPVDSMRGDFKKLNVDSSAKPEGKKTPKDVNLKLNAHTDEAGKKEVDFKFHFEGKRDHLDDDKDDKKDKDKDDDGHRRDKMIDMVQTAAMAMAEHGKDGPSEMVGAAVTAVGNEIAGHGRSPEEMAEFREKGGVVGVVKQKIGEKMYEKGEELKTKHPGEVVRTVPDAIKYHYAHAENYHREALIQQELSHKDDLKRGDRKEAKRRARELFDMEKAELSRAHAQERLLAAPVKFDYLDAKNKEHHHEHPAEYKTSAAH
jgi:hypothetical protein